MIMHFSPNSQSVNTTVTISELCERKHHKITTNTVVVDTELKCLMQQPPYLTLCSILCSNNNASRDRQLTGRVPAELALSGLTSHFKAMGFYTLIPELSSSSFDSNNNWSLVSVKVLPITAVKVNKGKASGVSVSLADISGRKGCVIRCHWHFGQAVDLNGYTGCPYQSLCHNLKKKKGDRKTGQFLNFQTLHFQSLTVRSENLSALQRDFIIKKDIQVYSALH